jgi:hypothetical protein
VRVDARPHLDFLDLDGLLLLARLGGLLLRLEFVFAVVEDLDDRRLRIGGDLYEIEAGFLGELARLFDVNDATVLTFVVDELDLRNADLIVDPGPFLDGRGSTIGTANGQFSSAVCRDARI